MNKLIIGIFVIGFWVFLPIGFIFTGITGYDSLGDEINDFPDNVSALTYLTTMFKYIWFFFKIIFLWIPNVPTIINFFLLVLKYTSLLVVYLLIRGN